MSDSKQGITLKNVHKTFPPDVKVVDGINLEIEGGKLTALIGPSGCGKTTLLRMIGGFFEPDQGEITLSSEMGSIGVCFQEPRLLPWRNVRANVGLPLELGGVAKAERSKAVDAAIDLVGLTDASQRIPAELSGGMSMRAALARSLVTDPELLLLDEPFGGLDEVTRLRIDEDVSKLLQTRDVTVLLVTHSITEAVFLADEVVVLSDRPASIVDRFTVDFESRDANLRSTPEFAEISARIYKALRSGMRTDS